MCKCSEDAPLVLAQENTDMTTRRNAKPGEQVRYIGANIGGYIPGVPMKDMGDEEWNALDSDLRVLALGSGMYELGGDPAEAIEAKEAAQDAAAGAPAATEAPKEAEKSAKSSQEKPEAGKDAKGGD
jgi:hypothetical protein